MFVYIPNGVNGMTWQVTKPGRGFELSPSLQPLENIAMISAFSAVCIIPMESVRRHVCADTWLTGAKIDAQSARKYENTVSIDQLMAEVTGQHTRLPSLELSIIAGTGQPAQFGHAGVFAGRRATAGGG